MVTTVPEPLEMSSCDIGSSKENPSAAPSNESKKEIASTASTPAKILAQEIVLTNVRLIVLSIILSLLSK